MLGEHIACAACFFFFGTHIPGICLCPLLRYNALNLVDFFWLSKAIPIVYERIPNSHQKSDPQPKKLNCRDCHHVFSQSLCIPTGSGWSNTHCCIYMQNYGVKASFLCCVLHILYCIWQWLLFATSPVSNSTLWVQWEVVKKKSPLAVATF